MNDKSMQRMIGAAMKRAMAARVMVMAMRGAGEKESKGGKAMGTVTRVACNKEGNVKGGKSAGNKGGGQVTATRAVATATLMTWVMAMEMRLAGDKE